MRFLIFVLISLFVHGAIFTLFSKESGFRLLFKKGTPASTHISEIVSTPSGSKGEPSQKKQVVRESSPSGIVNGASLGIPAPEYPESSRLKSEEGSVLVLIIVDSKGALFEAKILKSSGFPLLDQAALQAVSALPKADPSSPKTEHQVQFTFRLNNVN